MGLEPRVESQMGYVAWGEGGEQDDRVTGSLGL